VHRIWLRGLARCTSMNVVANWKRVLMATDMHVAVSGMTGQPVVVLLHCMGRSGTMQSVEYLIPQNADRTYVLKKGR